MLYNYCQIFLYFFVFSIIGYLVEVCNVSIIDKKINFSRGFLIGPYLPIYGIGALIMTQFLEKYKNDVIVLFVMGMVICSILEYITSYILEKIFNVRWWDYSNKKYNVDGRICLENGFLFGLGGVIVIKVLNPIVYTINDKISSIAIIIIGIICSIIFFLDLIETLYIMSKLKINSSKFSNKDATGEVRQKIKNELYKHNTLTARLLKSFPNVNNNQRKEIYEFNKLVFKAREEIKKLKREEKLKQLKTRLKEEKKKLKKSKKSK